MGRQVSNCLVSTISLMLATWMAVPWVQAQKTQNVNIQGSSITVPVAVTNNPSVTVNNSSPIPVTLSPDANLKLDTSAPVRIRDAENPARHAVHLVCFSNLPPDSATNFCTFKTATGNDYYVPVGKRLVIESVSGSFQTWASLVNGPHVQWFDLPTMLNGELVSVSHYFVPVQVPSREGYAVTMFSGQVRLYADQSTQLLMIVERTSNVTGNLQANLSGYLVHCGPGSGCPAP